MKKSVFLFLVLHTMLFGTTLQPTATLQSSGGVRDMLVNKNRLYVATNVGCVDIFTLKERKKVKSICVSPLIDFMGDEVASKIFSVDVNSDKILLLSQAKMGYRRVDIYENGALTNIINVKDELAIAKAKFIDEKHLLFALLSDDIILYNIETKKQEYTFQSSTSKFSDFALNEERSEVVVADESGDLRVYATKDGKLLRVLRGKNLDNVFQVDYKNGVIATAGQDRRCVIYTNHSSYIMKSKFLIYSVGLSKTATLAAFQSSEDNDVTLFNTKSREILVILEGNKMNISKILFLNEKELLISSDNSVINYYKIDKVK